MKDRRDRVIPQSSKMSQESRPEGEECASKKKEGHTHKGGKTERVPRPQGDVCEPAEPVTDI